MELLFELMDVDGTHGCTTRQLFLLWLSGCAAVRSCAQLCTAVPEERFCEPQRICGWIEENERPGPSQHPCASWGNSCETLNQIGSSSFFVWCNVGITIINHPPVITIDSLYYKPFPNGWFMALLYTDMRIPSI